MGWLLLRVFPELGWLKRPLAGRLWGPYDLRGAGVVHVRQQWTKYGELTAPKTKKGRRRVPLSPEDGKYLKTLKVAALGRGLASPESFVFASQAGTPLGHRNVQRRGFEAARDAAELPEHLTFHSLRHAFASYAAHRGVPISVLSEVLGHSNIGVTQRVYVHLYGRDQAEDQFRNAMQGGQA